MAVATRNSDLSILESECQTGDPDVTVCVQCPSVQRFDMTVARKMAQEHALRKMGVRSPSFSNMGKPGPYTAEGKRIHPTEYAASAVDHYRVYFRIRGGI